MAEYKDKNGTTRIGDLLRSLGDVGKPILKAAAGLTGQEWLNVVANGIKSSSDLKNEQKQLLLSVHKMDLDAVADARKNETTRDISQYSSWLSKNIHELIALMVSGAWIISWWAPAVVAMTDVKDIVLIIMGYLFGRSQPNSK